MDVVPFLRRRRMLAAAAVLPLLALAGCAAGGADGGGAAAACDFPPNKIEFVVPYSSGGGFDTWARLIAPALETELDTTIPVVNREGAGGIVGVTEVFSSKPDGSTIVISEPGILATTQLAGQTDLDFSSLQAVARATVGPEVIVVAGDSPWNTIEDVQAAAPAGTKLLMATGGLAAINIVAFDKLGIDYDNIIHDGSSEALLSIIRGDTDISVYPLSSVAEGITNGDLKPLVVVGDIPGSENPDAGAIEGVPTLDEVTGEDGLGAALVQSREILVAPGTDQCIVDALSTATENVFSDADFLATVTEAGLVPAFQNAADAQATYDNVFAQLEQYSDLLTEKLAG